VKMYKAAAYMRLSVAGRSETESESIANQEYCIRRFVDEHPDIEIVSCRIDDGYSGLIFQRPSFCAMLQDATAGKINCIIVRDLSRFGREFVETGRYLRNILPAYGIRFIAISDGLDTNRISAKDDLLMQIKSAINDEFSRDISMKTRRALSAMRKNGLYVGACPVYGYLKSNEDRHQLLIDEYAANIIRDIFDMKISGASAAVIANELNDRNILSPLEYKKSKGLPCSKNGFANKPNSRWSASTIIRILKDETYIGTLVQGKQYSINYKIKKQVTKPADEWIRTEKAHESIVPYYDFQTVQRLMLLDTRISPGNNRLGLFSGLLICSNCGNNMVRKIVALNGKYYVYYRCTNGKNSCASPVSICEDILVFQVAKQIDCYISRVRDFLAQASHMSVDNINHELSKGFKAELKEKQLELEKYRHFKSMLNSTLIDGIISEGDYIYMRNKYSDEISVLVNKVEVLACEINTTIIYSQEQFQRLHSVCEYYSRASLNRVLLANIVNKIYVNQRERANIKFSIDIY